MKFFNGQRVRIKTGVPCNPQAAHLFGTVCRIDREMTLGELVRAYGLYGAVFASAFEPRYWLDVKVGDETVLAAESALEPVFDQPEKISWFHSAVVWRPREVEPAVMRSSRVRA